MANKPQFQPKLPFLICLVWYRLRDLVQGGLAVDATRSAIADLVCMRTKLLRWSVFRPHFTSKVSFFPLGCFESPIALPRRQTRGSWLTFYWKLFDLKAAKQNFGLQPLDWLSLDKEIARVAEVAPSGGKVWKEMPDYRNISDQQIRHCSQVGPHFGIRVPMGTFFSFWVPIFYFRLKNTWKVSAATI